jgi:hypothetical protein
MGPSSTPVSRRVHRTAWARVNGDKDDFDGE